MMIWEEGIRDQPRSRWLGDVFKRQYYYYYYYDDYYYYYLYYYYWLSSFGRGLGRARPLHASARSKLIPASVGLRRSGATGRGSNRILGAARSSGRQLRIWTVSLYSGP